MKVKMWPLKGQINVFIDLILDKENCSYINHSWRGFLDLNFDVFHMHWPETYLNQKNVIRRYAGTLFVLLYLVYLKISRKKIIWTVHNIFPHENSSPRFSIVSYKLFAIFSDVLIFMSESSKADFLDLYKVATKQSTKVIYHPLYPCEYADSNGITNDKKHLLYFGLIRPYKNVITLINEYKVTSQKIPLRILGSCSGISECKVREISEEGNVDLLLHRYTNKELTAHLSSCYGVVIPYTQITNSGVLYQAISCGVKLLIPRLNYTEEVIQSLHYRNVIFYDGEISSEDIEGFFNFEFIEKSTLNIEEYNAKVRCGYLSCYRGI